MIKEQIHCLYWRALQYLTWGKNLPNTLLFYRGVSMLGRILESCRYRCQPARGTLPVMTVCSPETPSAAGMGKCVWKYLHVHKSKGTCTQKKRIFPVRTQTQCILVSHTCIITQCMQKNGVTEIWQKTNKIHLLCSSIDPESILP